MSAVRASISSLQYLSLIFPSQKFNLSIWSACLPCPPCQAKKSQMAVRKSKYPDWICRKGSILQNDLSVFTLCVAVKVWCSLLAPEHLCHTGLELQKAPQRCIFSPPLKTRTAIAGSQMSRTCLIACLLLLPAASQAAVQVPFRDIGVWFRLRAETDFAPHSEIYYIYIFV